MQKVNLMDESDDCNSQYKYIETVKLDTVNVVTINSHDDTKLFMHIQQKTVQFQIITGLQ